MSVDWASSVIKLIWDRKIDPGKVFGLTLALQHAAEVTRRWTNAAPPRLF